ncbi:amino acid/amide ABC transporter ATP-binding protein 2 (HAAT family) [Gemmobacter caeni]|uniref:Amino acid/amide ABC transporter ATP-binding protein 2 (HAAT family) n=1 Tax=Gemmobacter caeni TaxID=589035 RepID=A0A2T6B1W6_9RHOB|nr:ABC transporter ATP-binding protein [Gemmobacter caeni]PTX50058.1 amino acid/amide ABC transporter ATP-binding protein 2 (HAAT family) [Gemmobacter caeni]TWJ01953.1 amino acid/amide ABC transporter ATP-binding protein 2 (HAAT family) [Gemmobacter caeni]
MLVIEGLTAGYGGAPVLHGVGLGAAPGKVTCVMGRNGAGKTTLMRAIMGQLRASSGTIHLDGEALHGLPAHEVPRHGVALVPQGRRLFGPLTVAENIEIGLMTRRKGRAVREHVLDLFPRLRERLNQQSRTLSGGEQQMLALARALCLEPKVLLLDEPTEGLQPSMIRLIRDTVLKLKATGVAVVLVEQRVEAVLEVADSVAFMAQGRVTEVLPAHGLTPQSPQFATWVGV